MLYEFKIAEKKEARLTNNINGNVIFVSCTANKNFSGLDLKPGAIMLTKIGINNSTIAIRIRRKIDNKLKILLAKFRAFVFPFINSFE